MLNKFYAFAALALLSAFAAADPKPLIINRVLINAADGSDDGQGLEMFEIKNTSSSTVDLSDVTLVIIDNEGNRMGQLDGWYQFSGTLGGGQTLCIQDLTKNGSQPTVSMPNGTSNGSSIGYEFFSGHTGTDLSNSGANYVLVQGFNTSAVTWGGYLDANSDGTLDLIPWTTSLDGICIYPDSGSYSSGQANYISQLGMSSEHTLVAAAVGAWTPDYIMRMYRVDGSGNKIYDRFIQSDIEAYGSSQITFDTDQFTWDTGTSVGASNVVNSSGTAYSSSSYPTFYVGVAQGGNFTDWTSFDHIKLGSYNYFH